MYDLKMAVCTSVFMTLASAQPISAIVVRGDPDDFVLDPGEAIPGADGLNHGGVAKLVVDWTEGPGVTATGFLLRGGKWIVTAAHVLDSFAIDNDNDVISINITFGNVPGPILGGNAHHTHHHDYVDHGNFIDSSDGEGFSSTSFAGYDLALIELNNPIENIEGYRLFNGNATGQEFIQIGYGVTGNGVNQFFDGKKRYGRNKIEVGKFVVPAIGFPGIGSAREETRYFVDFDNGLHNNDGQRDFDPPSEDQDPNSW